MSATKVIRTFGAPRRKRKPSTHRAEPGPGRPALLVRLGRERLQPPQPPERGQRHEGVDGVGGREPAPVDEQPGHQRADHHRASTSRRRRGRWPRAAARAAGSAGRCSSARASSPRRRRSTRRRGGRAPRRSSLPSQACSRARDRRGPRDEVGDERHDAPVVVVRQRPAVEPHDDERHEREEPDEPDRRRRPGDVVDLQADRDDRHLRADVGEREARPTAAGTPAFSRSGVRSGRWERSTRRSCTSGAGRPGRAVHRGLGSAHGQAGADRAPHRRRQRHGRRASTSSSASCRASARPTCAAPTATGPRPG